MGLASATSTSKSLNIFTRGLSSIARNMLIEGMEYREFYFHEFKSLLHRSKAHYGFDLLISVENFFNKNFPENDINVPEVLSNIEKNNDYKLEAEEIRALAKMRENIIEKYVEAMDKIANNFEQKITELTNNCEGNKYLIIFGYSRVVRNALIRKAKFLKDEKIKIFVMKEDDEKMLDTRMLRFELNDQKPINNIRTTFTSSDHFLLSLINQKDKVIMVAGAEAYDKKNNALIHTNYYRVHPKLSP